MNVISGFAESSMMNSVVNDKDERKLIGNSKQLKLDLALHDGDSQMNMLSPPNANLSPSNSRSSPGSFVGKNEIFVPKINFQGEITPDPLTVYTKHSKPNEAKLTFNKGVQSQMKRLGRDGKVVEIKESDFN